MYTVRKWIDEEIYEPGDFVCIYEGMGEGTYGTVIKRDERGNYVCKDYFNDYKMVVSPGDMRGIRTEKEAHEYFLARSGHEFKR